MEDEAVRRLAIVLSVQAEIDGMKAENDQRKLKGLDLKYGEEHFNDKAEELRNLAYTHPYQLFG